MSHDRVMPKLGCLMHAIDALIAKLINLFMDFDLDGNDSVLLFCSTVYF